MNQQSNRAISFIPNNPKIFLVLRAGCLHTAEDRSRRDEMKYKILLCVVSCVILTVSWDALRAVLAGPAGRAVAVVVALRGVARRAVRARRLRAVVAVVLRTDTLFEYFLTLTLFFQPQYFKNKH